MRIGLDVMGGDHAPDAILDGAVLAASELDTSDQLVLVGERALIEDHLSEAGVDVTGASGASIEIVASTEVITMDDSPVEAVRTKTDSSITVLARMASRRADRPLDAIISAGNTGAKVTAAQMYMRRLPGVLRPGVAVTMPTFSGPVVLIDVGANIEPKPSHLAQYGVMGDVYARLMCGIERPRVALMNVGGEEQKGTTDTRRARDILRDVPDINFTGFVEGRGVFDGAADVVITDGVVGNVMIKLAEGLSAGIFKAIGREVAAVDPEMARRFEPVVRKIYAEHDYHEYGGAPLLGVNGVCIISHGSSVARTIRNAIRTARKCITSQVNERIVERLATVDSRDEAA